MMKLLYTQCFILQTLREMLSQDTIKHIRSRITDDRTHDPLYYEPDYTHSPPDGGTSHISVLAPDGGAVSVTSTINR